MSNETSRTELLYGAINFDRLEQTARGLRAFIYGPGFIPIRSKLRPGTFPDFMAKPFALTDDHGNIINVWCVRDEVENYHVIGGVAAEVDKRGGYIQAYERVLNDILANDEASRQIFAVLDHVVTKYLLQR